MKTKRIIPLIISFFFIIALWEFIAWQVNVPAIFPSFKDLVKETVLLFATKSFYPAVGATLLRGLIGITLAFLLAFLFGTLATFSFFWKTFFEPIIVILRSVPIISFILLALLWFSPNQLPMFIAVITVFPIIYQSVQTALSHTDIRLVEMAKVFGKTPVKRFMTIYLPSSRKAILDGISTAVGFGWRAIIMGEALSQPLHGIGSGMKAAQAYIQVPKLLAWTLVAIGVSYFFEFILRKSYNIKKYKKYPTEFTINKLPKQINSGEKSVVMSSVTKYFENHLIFKNYSDSFNSSAIHCLKGCSGRGKTTLLRMLSHLDTEYSGIIKYPSIYSLSYAFQDVRLLPWLTVRENVLYVLNNKYVSKEEQIEVTNFILSKLDLAEHSDKLPGNLSGGQQQRVGLARALAVQPDVILLDEPLTGLNIELKEHAIQFIFECYKEYHPLIIWATHVDIKSTQDIIIQEHLYL